MTPRLFGAMVVASFFGNLAAWAIVYSLHEWFRERNRKVSESIIDGTFRPLFGRRRPRPKSTT